ncbi:uncharacterized protein LOC112082023 [Eutrema salsugineum]|uniref:uncharacterized protein LOC112082023 n=1 Tax=Eutrema salsugineum TaxID=72664 RepID=UPI000CED022D|nr:uncharacterized protein LOC112082023 [Eutrema salsugineum]
MVSELMMIHGDILNKTKMVSQEDLPMKKAKVRETKATVQESNKNEKLEKKMKMVNQGDSAMEKAKVKVTEATVQDYNKNKKEEENHVFTARQEGDEANKEDVLLIDSGCTNHITPNKKAFVNLNTSIRVPIKVGNGAVLISEGKGDTEVITKKGKRIIRDVFLVPKLGKNLLSVPQMITNGYKVTFEESKCIIHDSAGRKIGVIPMVNKSFHIR